MSREDLRNGFLECAGADVELTRVDTSPDGVEFTATHAPSGHSHVIVLKRPRGQHGDLGRQAGEAFGEWLRDKLETLNATPR